MTWRRLAAATAAGLLGIHACRVYDESDTEHSEEVSGEPTGGRSASASGGEPPFNGAPGGRGGSGGSGSSAKGGSAAVGGGGRGGSQSASSGGTSAATGAMTGQAGEGAGGDPGEPPSDGGAPSDAGASNQGGAPDATGGTPSAAGGTGGSGTGGASTGGSATGGSATGGAPVAPELIDDGEDANNRIRTNAGRNGYWSTFDANTGCNLSPKSNSNPFMTMAQDGTGTGDYALHFVSSGGGVAGCGVNLEFTSPVTLYDASAYTGVSFGARSQGSARTLLFRIAVDSTDPRFSECSPTDASMLCYDHFQTTVDLTTTWQEIVVSFEDLAQEGWGLPAGDFDPSKLVAIQWLSKPGTADIWIDDVKFVSD